MITMRSLVPKWFRCLGCVETGMSCSLWSHPCRSSFFTDQKVDSQMAIASISTSQLWDFPLRIQHGLLENYGKLPGLVRWFSHWNLNTQGFGPIDHQGCDNLRTHHGDARKDRCGTFWNSASNSGWYSGLHWFFFNQGWYEFQADLRLGWLVFRWWTSLGF